MFSWNSVGIAAEKRLTCLSLYQEWNLANTLSEFCWHCCRKTLDVLTNNGWQSRMIVSRRICVYVQYELWVIRRDFIAICKLRNWEMVELDIQTDIPVYRALVYYRYRYVRKNCRGPIVCGSDHVRGLIVCRVQLCVGSNHMRGPIVCGVQMCAGTKRVRGPIV